MQKSLIDSGPLISLFDRSDFYHKPIVGFLKTYKGELYTSWAVVTEVSHMLDFSLQAQLDFYEWISRGGLKIIDMPESSFAEIRELTHKYGDIPMDLADASLLILSKKLKIEDIITLDSDYKIYRIGKKKIMNNLLDKFLKKK